MLKLYKNAIKGFWGVGLLLFCGFIFLQGIPSAFAAEEQPEKIYIGAYLLSIPSMSLSNNQFTVDFYIWFRWKNEKLKPYESFEISNGVINEKNFICGYKLKDGWQYANARVQATITKYWDVARYPFDKHFLAIEIEDNESDTSSQVYVADDKLCGVDNALKISGWKVGKVMANAIEHEYATNWGDTNFPADQVTTYSRFVFAVELQRDGITYSIKMLYALCVSIFIALSALWIKPSNLDPRFGLPVGAAFALIASLFVVASNLPEAAQLTIMDKLHIIAGILIVSVIFESVLSLKLDEIGRVRESKWLDRFAFIAFLLLALVFGVWAVI